jgi:hypothetical protein
MGELRPQIIMVKYIIPAMLPPSPPRRTAKLDSKIIEKYAGNYEIKKLNIPLTIFKEGDTLFYKSPDKEIGVLFPETETQFFGVSKRFGEFQANFINDELGKTKHLSVQVGFGGWQFVKIK